MSREHWPDFPATRMQHVGFVLFMIQLYGNLTAKYKAHNHSKLCVYIICNLQNQVCLTYAINILVTSTWVKTCYPVTIEGHHDSVVKPCAVTPFVVDGCRVVVPPQPLIARHIPAEIQPHEPPCQHVILSCKNNYVICLIS